MDYVINTPAQLKPILVGYRKSNGMSQRNMAEKLNVTQQAYQALESNPQSATVERLMKVLNILGVKLCLSENVNQSLLEEKDIHKSNLVVEPVITKLYERAATVHEKVVQEPAKNTPSNSTVKKLNKDSW